MINGVVTAPLLYLVTVVAIVPGEIVLDVVVSTFPIITTSYYSSIIVHLRVDNITDT